MSVQLSCLDSSETRHFWKLLLFTFSSNTLILYAKGVIVNGDTK